MAVRDLSWEEQPGLAKTGLGRAADLGRAATSVGLWVRASPVSCGLIAVMSAVRLLEGALIGQVHGHKILSYLAFGALPNATVVGRGNPGQWWRYVANGVVHDRTLLHLVSNSLALLLVGAWVERTYGKLAMLASLILAVAAGSITWVVMSGFGLVPQPDYTVGCSAGICGLVGIMLVHGYRCRGALGRDAADAIKLRATLGIALMVLIGLLLPQLNNFAHGGGLAGGLVLGGLLPLRGDTDPRPWLSHGSRLALAAVVLAGAVALVLAGHNLGVRLTAP